MDFEHLNMSRRLIHCTKYKRVKLRDFQYRLLLGKVITNVDLFEWNLKEDPLCTFCERSCETLVHLYCECPRIISIRKKFYDLCKFNDINVKTDDQSFLLNMFTSRNTT